jgi:transcriptional antiterminator NusG
MTSTDEREGVNVAGAEANDHAGSQAGGESSGETGEVGSQDSVDQTDASAVVPEAPKPAAPKVEHQLPMQWYVLRVASNREDQVCEALTRKVKIEHLDNRIGRILVPTQREKRMRGRVAKVINRKLYPGYCFVHDQGDDERG